MRKYYLAYEDRYKKVHSEGLTWFSDIPTPELCEWIEHNSISINEDICEIGCGEGRDALYLSSKGYKITAIDASESAIIKCRELSAARGNKVNWVVGDALFLDKVISKPFKWAYSIATLHMLVDDDDRSQFLGSIYNILEPDGRLLLVSMGDGVYERKTDTSNAFELQERNHMATGKKMLLAGTSYRGVSWEHHKQELERAGFIIEKVLNSKNHEYNECMTVYLRRN